MPKKTASSDKRAAVNGHAINQINECSRLLKESQERWRSLAENVPNYITVIDDRGIIQYINHPVPGLPADQVVGKSVYEFIMKEYHKVAEEKINNVLRTGKADFYTSQAVGPFEGIAWYENYLGPIKENGRVSGVTIIGLDISKRKIAEERISLSSAHIQLVNELTHELNDGATLEQLIKKACDRLKDIHHLNFTDLFLLFQNGDAPAQLVYKYINLDKKPLSAVESLLGVRIIGYLIPLFDNSVIHSFYRDKKPRELKTKQEITAFIRDMAAPESRLLRKFAGQVAKLIDSAYIYLVPLIVKGEVIGHMGFNHTHAFSEHEKEAINLVTDKIATIIERKESEEALRDSEKRYRSLFDNMIDGFAYQKIVLDKRGKPVDYIFVEVNDAFETLTGVKKEALVGQRVSKVLPAITRDPYKWIDKYGAVAMYGDMIRFEQFVEPFGKWYSIAAYSPKEGYFTTIFEDITQRKSSERALRESEEHYRGLYYAMPLGYPSLSADGKFIDVNPAWLKELGYSRDEIVGKPFTHFLVTDSVKSFEKKFRRLKTRGDMHGAQFQMKAKDGTLIDVAMEGKIEQDTTGKFKAHCILTNITEQKRADEALRKERDRAQMFLDIAGVIFVALDAKGDVILINQKGCKVLGYKEKDILGINWFDNFVPPRMRDEVSTIFGKLMSGSLEMTEYFENPLLTKTGDERMIAWHNTILKDDSGKPIGTLSSGEDITTRRTAEEQIEKDLREKEVLLKEIHHRVKNNLQVIISLLNLQSQQIRDAQMLKTFKECKNRIYSMALVHEKLYRSENFSKIDFDDYATSMVKGLFKAYEITGQIHLTMKIKNIDLEIDTAIPCGLILNELVSNALKYAFPKGKTGEIKVMFKTTQPNHYMLTVQDNGIGLPEHIDFDRTDTLGLRLVRILTEQIGGTVVITRNRGTRFTIEFSISEE